MVLLFYHHLHAYLLRCTPVSMQAYILAVCVLRWACIDMKISFLFTTLAMIWHSGHGERGTGNWCFKDGTVSFQDIFDHYMKHFWGSILTVISDSCYSGKWVYACADILDQMGIPPCGHKTKKRGMLIKVFASCQPSQKAADPCYSLDAVEIDRSDGYMSFWNYRKLRDKQQTFHANFTKLVCCRDPS